MKCGECRIDIHLPVNAGDVAERRGSITAHPNVRMAQMLMRQLFGALEVGTVQCQSQQRKRNLPRIARGDRALRDRQLERARVFIHQPASAHKIRPRRSAIPARISAFFISCVSLFHGVTYP